MSDTNTYRLSVRVQAQYLDMERESGLYIRNVMVIADVTTDSEARARSVFADAVRERFPGCWKLDMGYISIQEAEEDDDDK